MEYAVKSLMTIYSYIIYKYWNYFCSTTGKILKCSKNRSTLAIIIITKNASLLAKTIVCVKYFIFFYITYNYNYN